MSTPAPQNKSMPAGSMPQRPPAIPFTALQLDGIAIGAILLMSAAIYVLGINPLLERHASAIRQQAELENVRQSAVDAQKTLADLRLQSTSATEQLEASPLRLQPASLLNQRLSLVTELATQGGAALDDLQPGKSNAGSRYDAMPIHVAGTGTFPAFTAMLHQVHSTFPDTGVSTFELAADPRDETSKAKFSLELLWFTEPVKRPGKGATVTGDKSADGSPGEAEKGSGK